MATYRLPPDLQADLVWYWCESEAGLGVRSSMGAQQQQLLASSCPDPPPSTRDPGAALQRWRVASPEERHAMRVARWNAADDLLRSDWRTMKVAASPPSARQEQLLGDLAPDDLTQTTFEPDWARLVGKAAEARRRSVEVHSSLCRLRRGAHGVTHQLVLFRVYGDPLRDSTEDEVKNLRGYAETVSELREMLLAASRAYADAHRAERDMRREDRRRRFDHERGAA